MDAVAAATTTKINKQTNTPPILSPNESTGFAWPIQGEFVICVKIEIETETEFNLGDL